MVDTIESISCSAVLEAADRLAPWAHRTPVLSSRTLDEAVGGSVFLKCENFQRAGAFKFRGAMNTLLQLSETERSRGVVTHSSGNHGQALALAGRLSGVKVCVVMPKTAPTVKRRATLAYGAEVVSCEPTLDSREATVARLIGDHGYTLVHPFDDWRVAAGQGTAALELLDEVGSLDYLVAPIGGGGLAAGCALALEARGSKAKLVGVEPAAVDDAKRSLEAGERLPSGDARTIADGLKASIGVRPFSLLRNRLWKVFTSSEDQTIDALQYLWERLKIVVEPSSTVAFAPILNQAFSMKGARVGLIVSGGNIDVDPMFDHLRTKWLASE